MVISPFPVAAGATGKDANGLTVGAAVVDDSSVGAVGKNENGFVVGVGAAGKDENGLAVGAGAAGTAGDGVIVSVCTAGNAKTGKDEGEATVAVGVAVAVTGLFT